MVWIILVFVGTLIPPPPANNQLLYQLQWNNFTRGGILNRIIAARYREEICLIDLDQFSIGHTQIPLILISWYIFLVWFSSYNHQCPQWFIVLFYHTVFILPSYRIFYHFGIMWSIPSFWLHMGGFFLVSIWKENPCIGLWHTYSQNPSL